MLKKIIYFGFLSYLLSISSGIPVEKQIHKFMTEREQRIILNSKSEYKLASVKIIKNSRSKRDIDNSTDLQLETIDGESYKFSLEESDHVLYGSDTPIFLATGQKTVSGDIKINYEKKPFPIPENMKAYHDRNQGAALTIYEDEDGEVQINGLVGDDLAIRSIPFRIRQRIPNNTNEHILLKLSSEEAKKNIDKFIEEVPSFRITETQKGGKIINRSNTTLQIIKCHDVNISINVKEFMNNLRRGILQNFTVNGVVKKWYDILKILREEGYLEPEERDDFGSITFRPSGEKQLLDVNKFKQDLLNRTPIQYRSSISENKSVPQILEELGSQGITFPPLKGDTVYPKLLITMDYKTVERFNNDIQEITKYMAAYWNGVDLKFREIENPKIRINIAGIIIPQNAEGAAYLENENTTAIFYSIKDHFTDNINVFHPHIYDFVVAFFNQTVFPESGILGIAFNTTPELPKIIESVSGVTSTSVCKTNPGQISNLVNDVGDFWSVSTAAHELAHNLGLHHDYDVEYIMNWASSSSHNTLQKFHWSDDSKYSFTTYLRHLTAFCLYDKPRVGKPYPKLLPGRLMTRDQQCEKIEPNYYSPESNSNDCILLNCTLTDSGVWKANGQPADGTSCGDQKICLSGLCIPDPEKHFQF